MSIGEKAGQGFISFIYRNILARFLGVISLFVLAHKLSPADFGLVSITQVLLTIISSLGTSGLFEFLQSYKKDDFNTIVRATFWFNLVTSIFIFLVFLAVLPIWAHFKHDHRITLVGLLLGLNFLMIQLQIIPRAVLSRNLEFKKLVKLQSPFIVLTPLLNIAAAMGGFGVYSLALPALMVAPIQIFLMYRAIGWKFSRYLYRERWKEIFGFSKFLIGNTILSRITDEGDKLILGTTLGLEILGAYNMAFQLANFVNANIVTISSNILVSILPKYRDDLPAMKRNFLDFTNVISFVTFPLILLVLPFASYLILAANGPNWTNAIIPFQILSIYACLRSVTANRGAVLNALHQNKKVFRMVMVYTPIHIITSFISSYFFGVVGVATNLLLIRAIYSLYGTKETMFLMDGHIGEFFNSFKTTLWINILVLIICLPVVYFGWLDLIKFILPDFLFRSDAVINAVLFGLGIFFALVCYYFIGKWFFKDETYRICIFISRVFPRSVPFLKKLYNFQLEESL